jgi:hypothetical protein
MALANPFHPLIRCYIGAATRYAIRNTPQIAGPICFRNTNQSPNGLDKVVTEIGNL